MARSTKKADPGAEERKSKPTPRRRPPRPAGGASQPEVIEVAVDEIRSEVHQVAKPEVTVDDDGIIQIA